MNRWTRYSARIATAAVQTGFTMIELLVVIAILGILAVAILSAIDPIEQINRGRDTGTRSDAAQLLTAIDRYNAFNGYYPWVSSQAAADGIVQVLPSTAFIPQRVDHSWAPFDAAGTARLAAGTATTLDATTQCSVLARLSTGSTMAGNVCTGTSELKVSYVNKVTRTGYRGLFIFKQAVATAPGSSPYVCFVPQSAAFRNEAADRCNTTANGPLPTDFPPGACSGDATAGDWVNFTNASGTNVAVTGNWICLP